MEHLFREQEMREQECAEKAQYNMRVKIDRAEAERVMVYAERVPRNAKEVTTITIYRKNEPQRRVDLSRVEALRLISELREALAK